MTKINLKRIYEDPSDTDGYRLFIDRLWPRGMTREQVKYDEWWKDMAPSAGLRKWFHEDKTHSAGEFEHRYLHELLANSKLNSFRDIVGSHPVVTLLTATRDADNSYLSVLKKVLENTPV